MESQMTRADREKLIGIIIIKLGCVSHPAPMMDIVNSAEAIANEYERYLKGEK